MWSTTKTSVRPPPPLPKVTVTPAKPPQSTSTSTQSISTSTQQSPVLPPFEEVSGKDDGNNDGIIPDDTKTLPTTTISLPRTSTGILNYNYQPYKNSNFLLF